MHAFAKKTVSLRYLAAWALMQKYALWEETAILLRGFNRV
jgi:hypothetical protein